MSNALLLCDLWDRHWCRLAEAGTDRIAQLAAPVVERFRGGGGLVIHAPSDTMAAYGDRPARRRVSDLPSVDIPELDLRPRPPHPRSAAGQCHCQPICAEGHPWTAQHPAVRIDETDYVLDTGPELWAVLGHEKIVQVFVAGVHTNICVLGRGFGVEAMVRRGISCALVADLTEAMPASMTPETVEYVEDNWCPTLTSAELRP